jgi:hypothetical protein
MDAVKSNNKVPSSTTGVLKVSDVTKAHVGRTVSIYQGSYYRKLSLPNSKDVRLVGTLEDVQLNNFSGPVFIIDGEHYTCPNDRLWETVIVS